MSWIVSLAALGAGVIALARVPATLITVTLVFVGGLAALSVLGLVPVVLAWLLWPTAAVMVLMNIGSLRRRYLSTPVLLYIRRVLPPISAARWMSPCARASIHSGMRLCRGQASRQPGTPQSRQRDACARASARVGARRSSRQSRLRSPAGRFGGSILGFNSGGSLRFRR